MKRLISIYKGWYRFLFRKKSPRAKSRLSVCKDCELRKGRFCGVCWCELDALSELDEEELGICHYPDGSKWFLIDVYYKWINQKG
jgi:hypothetical protein